MATRAHTVSRFYLRAFADPESERDATPFLWVGDIKKGTIERRAPKNVSIVRGIYDGIGAFSDLGTSVEEHLSRIESDAAAAIREFVSKPGMGTSPQSPVWRFLAWQAARTPGWFALVEQWANEPMFWETAVVEPPPEGTEKIAERRRPQYVEEPATGERQEVFDLQELRAYQKRGWKWRLGQEDKLEALHMQAWYFQARHFARLTWCRLDSPEGEHFITSDRAVAWLVDGFADTPPAALRHPSAHLLAPLTRKTALVGRHDVSPLNVTPRQLNRSIAFAASEWVAGPTRAAVEQAMKDRSDGASL
jgi:hypothetical protein